VELQVPTCVHSDVAESTPSVQAISLHWRGNILRLHQIVRTTQLSLSRLNHRLPGREAHPEVMQSTADLHHQITDPLLPQAAPVLHDAAALDATVDMLDPEPTLVQGLVCPLLLPRERRAAGFLRRHQDLHLG
jgi:hypothetical protein